MLLPKASLAYDARLVSEHLGSERPLFENTVALVLTVPDAPAKSGEVQT